MSERAVGNVRKLVPDAGGEAAEALLRCVEALLMAAEAPLTTDQLLRLLDPTAEVDRTELRVALAALAAHYADSAVDLVEVAGGWRFQVGANYADLVAGLREERPPKLSRALLETLAIICYRQPLARSDIEAVRGVSVSTNIMRTLSDYEWIKVVGHREVPGRPALYATTPRFLDDFGVKRLDDLPSLPELRAADALAQTLARLQRKDDKQAGRGIAAPEVPERPPDESRGNTGLE